MPQELSVCGGEFWAAIQRSLIQDPVSHEGMV